MPRKATGAKAAGARSRLSTSRKAVVESYARMAKQLAQANALWRYWRDHDITDDDDHWSEFTDAVYAHLEGKPVPKRFLQDTNTPIKKGRAQT